jgi:aldehyde dehydrogenase (NAD+)
MNPYQEILDAQKELFASNVTRTYEWRTEQLERMGRMPIENEERLQRAVAQDFKTARQEYVFELFRRRRLRQQTRSRQGSWQCRDALREGAAPLAVPGQHGCVRSRAPA